jgi:hypothetical protein
MLKLVLWLTVIFSLELLFFLVGLGSFALLFPIIVVTYSWLHFVPDEGWFSDDRYFK